MIRHKSSKKTFLSFKGFKHQDNLFVCVYLRKKLNQEKEASLRRVNIPFIVRK